MKVYKRRNRRLELSLDRPFPEMVREIKKPKNIVRIALDVKAYLTINPNSTQTMVAEHYKLTRARISQLLKIVDNLPAHFIRKIEESEDPILLRRFSGKRLLKLASLTDPERIADAIQSLTPVDSI